jgi:protein-S-isoprenylcysteine O-methyltransferase Ste14
MLTDELQWRRLLVCASGLIYWGGVVIQARRVRKHIGRSPNLKPRGSREKALWFGWFVVILAWIGQPLLLGTNVTKPGLALLPALLHPVSLAVGLALVALGYAGTLWTYSAMGDTWRIGIDAKEKTALVSGGPYRWVRHPIYLLQIVMLAGAALLLPTPISLATLAAHSVCVLVKAGDEEKHLTAVHGQAYRDYLSRTGRLFPRLLWRGSSSGRQELPSGRD